MSAGSEPPLPNRRVDVVVVGAGPAGVSCALDLVTRERSLSVLLLDREAEAGPRARSGVLLALPGPDREALLRERGEERLRREEALVAAASDRLRELAALCGAEGCMARLPVVRLDGAQGAAGAVAAPRVVGEGVVDPDRWLAAARAAAVRRGVRFVAGVEVAALETDPGEGIWVSTGSGRVRALRAVLACGAGLFPFDAWTRQTTLPAACAAVALPGAPASLPRAFALRDGSVFGRVDADGVLHAAEGTHPAARGDPFAPGPHRPTLERLLARLERVLGWPPAPLRRRVRAVARPRLHTCDGLPLVGPHPGRASVLLCAGFSGLDEPLAALAGRFAAEWLLDGRPSHPEALLWSPRRML